jgi:hypothetical protein
LEVGDREVGALEVGVVELWVNFGILFPPLIPRFDALFELRQMFRIRHQSHPFELRTRSRQVVSR